MLRKLGQRLATLPREPRDTLFLLAVIAWIVLPHLGRLPWWCSMLAATVLAWRGRSYRRLSERYEIPGVTVPSA